MADNNTTNLPYDSDSDPMEYSNIATPPSMRSLKRQVAVQDTDFPTAASTSPVAGEGSTHELSVGNGGPVILDLDGPPVTPMRTRELPVSTPTPAAAVVPSSTTYFVDAPRVPTLPPRDSVVEHPWVKDRSGFLQAVFLAVGVKPLAGEDWLGLAEDWFREISGFASEDDNYAAAADYLAERLRCTFVITRYVRQALMSTLAHGKATHPVYFIRAQRVGPRLHFVAMTDPHRRSVLVSTDEMTLILRQLGGLLRFPFSYLFRTFCFL